jgi:hypothetical protein
VIVEILRHTPPWVFLLLAGLLVLGATQLRARRVHPLRLWALPLALLAMGTASTLAQLGAAPWAAPAWGLGLVAGFTLARRRRPPPGARFDAASGRLLLPGSVLPLALIVALFGLRYTAAVAQALHPAWRSAVEVVLPLALLYGALGGWFVGRTAVLWSLSRAETIGRDGIDASGPPAARA